MFQTDKIGELIKYALLTGYVDGDVPLSIMLISPPEHAKTSIISSVSCPDTIRTLDFSPKTFVSTIIPKIKNDRVHHVIIPDFIKITSHKESTVIGVVTYLNAALEEGLTSSMFFGQEFNLIEPLKFGLISSITPEFFQKMFRHWNDIGFITRFLPISYKYSNETVVQIHNAVANSKMETLIKKIDVLDGVNDEYSNNSNKVKVQIGKEQAAYISLIAQDIAKRIETYSVISFHNGVRKYIKPNMKGFRLHRQMRMLVSAIALSKNKTSVEFTDINEMKQIIEFVGFPNTAKEV